MSGQSTERGAKAGEGKIPVFALSVRPLPPCGPPPRLHDPGASPRRITKASWSTTFLTIAPRSNRGII